MNYIVQLVQSLKGDGADDASLFLVARNKELLLHCLLYSSQRGGRPQSTQETAKPATTRRVG